jgi:uncharacterized membrane protein (DUF4010 family)
MDHYLFEFRGLLIALALGLLVGLERGWSERSAAEGSRVAGIRTFGLIGLLGALWQLLAQELGAPALVGAFFALALLLLGATLIEIWHKHDYSITTPVAALITFALGAMAMTHHATLAAATAVITMILLGLKPVLHGWLRRLEPYELSAVFKLLLISIVLLPILPNRTFDPWQALNPYEIWWMVVLISAISFAGYFAVKIAGASRGMLLTGLFAGLVSSTAVALSLSRMGRTHASLQPPLSAGVIIASTTMFLRILLVAGLIQPGLIRPLSLPFGFMAVIGYLAAWRLIKSTGRTAPGEIVPLRNPFEFDIALRFGALLAAILLLTRIMQGLYGSVGIYLTAALSGISDVDAITLSLARMTRIDCSLHLAANGILLAALMNTLVKGLMVIFIARGTMARNVGATFLLLILAGLAGALAGSLLEPV